MRRVLLLALFLAAPASATVTVNSVVGTFQHGNSVGVSVSGQGTKSPAGPIVWADFASSTNPSSLGQKTSWDLIQNFTWNSTAGFAGTGGAVGTADSGIWTMRTDRNSAGATWSEPGQKNYIFRRTKMNFLVALDGTTHPSPTQNNWKTWRCYANPNTGGHPNIYFAANNGRAYVENVGVESGFWSNFNNATTNWISEQIIWSASSATDVKDGSLTYNVDGVDKASGSILTYTTYAPERLIANYVVHGVNANKASWALPAWSSSNQMWTDEVYADNTWQRVMIGNASTFASCNRFGFIIPTSWSTTNITGVLSCAAFSDTETAYIYVFDTNGTPNATGYAITINGTVAGAPAPTITSLSPSTGAQAGGYTVAMNGTNFVSGAQVSIAGLDAVTTFINSTQLTFPMRTFTGGTVYAYLVTVLNPDGQTAQTYFTYDATVASTNPPVDRWSFQKIFVSRK